MEDPHLGVGYSQKKKKKKVTPSKVSTPYKYKTGFP
jgi:hypothetical protein